MFDETRMREQCRWKTLSDLYNDSPHFAFDYFPKFVEDIKAGHCSLLIDLGTARELYPYFAGGYLTKLLNENLTGSPVWLTVVALAIALYTGNLMLLFGIPIALISYLGFGIPKPFSAPFSGIGTPISILFTLVAAWALINAQPTIAFLCAAFVVPFIAVRTAYVRSVAPLRDALLRSETLFLYLYQSFRCCILDRATGKTYSVVNEMASDIEKQMMNVWNTSRDLFYAPGDSPTTERR